MTNFRNRSINQGCSDLCKRFEAIWDVWINASGCQSFVYKLIRQCLNAEKSSDLLSLGDVCCGIHCANLLVKSIGRITTFLRHNQCDLYSPIYAHRLFETRIVEEENQGICVFNMSS